MRWVWWGPDLWTPQGVALPAQCPVIFIIQPGVRFPLGMTPRTQNSHNSVSVSSTVTPASGARHHPGCDIMCQDCTQPKLKIQPDKDKQTIFSFFSFFIFPIRLTQSLPSLVYSLVVSVGRGHQESECCGGGRRALVSEELPSRHQGRGQVCIPNISPHTTLGPSSVGVTPSHSEHVNTPAQRSCVPCVLTSQWNFRFRKASLVSRENKNS